MAIRGEQALFGHQGEAEVESEIGELHIIIGCGWRKSERLEVRLDFEFQII